MIKCPECGIEYNDDTLQCSFCGYNFKETPNKTVETEKTSHGKNRSNISAIFLGTLVYSVSMIFVIILIILLSLYYPLNLEILSLIFLIPLITGNILACWIGNSTYRQSILNGGIISILPIGALLIFGYGDPAVLALFFIIGALCGILSKFILTKLLKNPQTKSLEKIRLTIVFLFLIVGGILGTSMFIAGSSNMTYDKNGISFEYIGNLVALNNSENTSLSGTGNNLTVIAAFNGVNKTGSQSDHLVISQGAATLPLTDYVNAEKTALQKSNYKIISETNLTVDGVPATEINYNSSNGIAGVDLLLIKNNSLYSVKFNYNGDYNELQRYTVFLMIENSLNVK
jgi:hypothetical protein